MTCEHACLVPIEVPSETRWASFVAMEVLQVATQDNKTGVCLQFCGKEGCSLTGATASYADMQFSAQTNGSPES